MFHELREKFAIFYKENQCKVLYKTRSVLSWFCVDFSSFPDEFLLGSDEILMLRILHYLCKLLFTGFCRVGTFYQFPCFAYDFLVFSFRGVRFCSGEYLREVCASRPLLGSYVHQSCL